MNCKGFLLAEPVEMPFAPQIWDMCKLEAKEKHCIHADEFDGMKNHGLSTLPTGLQSQPSADACLEDDWFQHGISCASQGSSPASCLKLSDQACSMARQECQSLTFLDLTKSALKGSFSCENVRSSSFWSPYSSSLSVVSEDKPWDNSSSVCDSRFQGDGSSISSFSSSEDSSCSSEDVLEVQSSYKGPLANMCSLEEALPRKRGLSGFFAGKSRSFSCLADVASVKDLAKPANAYTKRRKYISTCIGNIDRLRMHPMRSGASGVSKKSLQNSKYTIALAVALSAEEVQTEGEQDCRSSRFARNLVPSRSYSLSDLQGAGYRCFPQ